MKMKTYLEIGLIFNSKIVFRSVIEVISEDEGKH